MYASTKEVDNDMLQLIVKGNRLNHLIDSLKHFNRQKRHLMIHKE
jgi:hypothetical protein